MEAAAGMVAPALSCPYPSAGLYLTTVVNNGGSHGGTGVGCSGDDAGGGEGGSHTLPQNRKHKTNTNKHSTLSPTKGDDMTKRNGCLIAFLIWIALVGLTAIGQQLLAAFT
jgi:hypothetical protein